MDEVVITIMPNSRGVVEFNGIIGNDEICVDDDAPVNIRINANGAVDVISSKK